jgi:hypothetical protein
MMIATVRGGGLRVVLTASPVAATEIGTTVEKLKELR